MNKKAIMMAFTLMLLLSVFASATPKLSSVATERAFGAALLSSPQPPPSVICQWNRTYGGADSDVGWSVQQTTDGGYIVAGSSGTWDPIVLSMLLIKVNDRGDVQWSTTYGGTEENSSVAHSVQQTSDGGYIVAGTTYGSSHGMCLVKTDASGRIKWSKTFQSTSWGDEGWSVQQTTDGGYVVAGHYRLSFDLGNWSLVKTDANGNKQWSRTFGGEGIDWAYSVQQTTDGGYAIAGATSSFGSGDFDAWLIKTDANGKTRWSRTYGGTHDDAAYSVEQTSDGGFMVAGYTYSFGAGDCDFWLIKTDASGNIKWNKTYDGVGEDEAESVAQTSDGGFIVAGYTYSFDTGDCDFWLVKTDASGNAQWNKTCGGVGVDVANSVEQTSDGGFMVAGYTYSFGAGDCDFWLVKLGAGIEITAPEKLDFNYYAAEYEGALTGFVMPLGFVRIRSIGYEGLITVRGFRDTKYGKYLYVDQPGLLEVEYYLPLGKFVDVNIFYGYWPKTPAPKESTYEITVELEDGTTYVAEMLIKRTGMKECSNGKKLYTGGTASFAWTVEDPLAYLEIEAQLPPGWSYSTDPSNGTVFETPYPLRINITAAPDAKEGDIGIITLRAFSNETKLMFWQFVYFAALDSTPPKINAFDLYYDRSINSPSIRCTADDLTTGIQNVQLFYSVDDGPWNNITMQWSRGDTFNSTEFRQTVPLIAKDSTLYYYVVATDWLDNQVQSRTQTYSFGPDVNGDGIVDIADLCMVARAWGSYPGHEYWNPLADINSDGIINLVDLTLVARNWGKTY